MSSEESSIECGGNPSADLFVATLSPLALFPIVLVIEHFGALVGKFGVVQGLCETTLAALAYTPPQESTDEGCTGNTGSDVDTDVGTFTKVIPFLGQRLFGLLV